MDGALYDIQRGDNYLFFLNEGICVKTGLTI